MRWSGVGTVLLVGCGLTETPSGKGAQAGTDYSTSTGWTTPTDDSGTTGTGADDSGRTTDTTDGTDSGDTTDDSGGTTDDSGGDTGGDTGSAPPDADGDGYDALTDCDDGDPLVSPGALETCDGVDTDCDGQDDDAEDADADGAPDCEDFCPVYVAAGALGDGREIDPMGVIQDAIELAGSLACYEVRVEKGDYAENLDWGGWPVNVESVDGPGATRIDGGGAASVVVFATGETAAARVFGFTITNGGGGEGAGIYVFESDPTIEGNIITDNHANTGDQLGGGIRTYNASPMILDNEITSNDAGYGGAEEGCDGGGLDIRGGEPIVQGNLIADNQAGDGGAIWLAVSDAWILQNTIVGNRADDVDPTAGGQGGGIDVQIAGSNGPLIESNVIADNTATMYGGGIVTYEYSASYGDATIANNTIVFNTVSDTDYGAGLLQWSGTAPLVYNNIIAYNHGTGVYAEDDIDSLFTYNDVYGNTTEYGGAVDGSGTGNLSVGPGFTTWSDDGDWANDDLTLGAGSACRDVGDPAVLDADGSRSDLGAFGGPEGAW